MASPNTTVIAKTAHTADANICTSGNRVLFLKGLREEVPQVELDVFFHSGLLPDLRDDIDVGQVLRQLRTVEPYVLLPSGKWNHFDRESVFKGEESPVHSKVVDIINAIATASGIPASEQTLTFQCIPISSTHNKNPKPSHIGVLADTFTGRSDWVDITVPAEFKTGTGVNDANEVRGFYIS